MIIIKITNRSHRLGGTRNCAMTIMSVKLHSIKGVLRCKRSKQVKNLRLMTSNTLFYTSDPSNVL